MYDPCAHPALFLEKNPLSTSRDSQERHYAPYSTAQHKVMQAADTMELKLATKEVSFAFESILRGSFRRRLLHRNRNRCVTSLFVSADSPRSCCGGNQGSAPQCSGSRLAARLNQ